jgi:hypothetical protein
VIIERLQFYTAIFGRGTEAGLGGVHAAGSGGEVVRERRVLGNVADEHPPLCLERVAEDGVVRNLLPRGAGAMVGRLVGVPYRLRRDGAVLDAAVTQARDGTAVRAVADATRPEGVSRP